VARHVRRVSALVAAAWLILGVVLGARHEAEEAHAIDAQGEAVHASQLIGHHTGDQSDIHGVADTSSSNDPCAVITALHQACSARVHAPTVAVVAYHDAQATARTTSTAAHVAAVYRLAPKTSPPAV
jgi:hypothetical protein